MNLYLISKKFDAERETYDGAVVCAVDEADARAIHPDGESKVPHGNARTDREFGLWASQDNVTVELIGIAIPTLGRGVVLASML